MQGSAFFLLHRSKHHERIEILDDHGLAARTVHVTANRSRTALQSATPVQREQIRYEMVRDLMADFDRQAETQLRNNFGTYLLSR